MGKKKATDEKDSGRWEEVKTAELVENQRAQFKTWSNSLGKKKTDAKRQGVLVDSMKKTSTELLTESKELGGLDQGDRKKKS